MKLPTMHKFGISILFFLTFGMIIAGIVGVRVNMYEKTGISMTTHWVKSEYDGIQMRLNYFSPNPDIKLSVGLILAHYTLYTN